MGSRLLEHWVLKKAFEPKREEVTGGWKKWRDVGSSWSLLFAK
jgi:hypothetical protein